jgi:hypothetical protein
MSASQQTFLFLAEQSKHADGSFTVRPKRLVDGREISAKAALKMLGFSDIETIATLVGASEIVGWKPATQRGNGKWRIDLGSVIDYKERRKREGRYE